MTLIKKIETLESLYYRGNILELYYRACEAEKKLKELESQKKKEGE